MIILSLMPLFAQAAERCGWLENPKIGYWYLVDPSGRWAIAEGADHEAEGFGLIPDIYSGEYEPMNRYYGYTCSCLDVSVDEISQQVIQINAFRSMPMSSCEANENLAPITTE